MDATEGVSRIAKLISGTAWVILLLGIVFFAYVALFEARPEWGALFGLLAVVTVIFALMQSVVWVIDGFIGNKDMGRNFLWPYKRKALRAKKLAAPGKASRQVAKNADLKGVHGWLFFFVLTLMVFSPLRTLGETARNISDAERAYPTIVDLAQWGNYKTAIWMAVLAYSIALVWAGWSLMRHFIPSSVSAAIAVMWICPIALLAIDMYASITFLEMEASEYFSTEIIGGMMGGLVYAGIWTAYLKLSRRVKNTYYADWTTFSNARQERSEPTL
ncbi:DUF2569 family protein [Pusillimonas sp.]|uniref:DUF2569 family protein n=1 Tax=Pusillimonas sp. TaxID=3040095 RepID=UPI0037C561FE